MTARHCEIPKELKVRAAAGFQSALDAAVRKLHSQLGKNGRADARRAASG